MKYLLILFTSFCFGQFNPIFFAGGGKGSLNNFLSASYNLNNNTTDQTGLSPTGTPTGIDYVSGVTGQAARFDSATDKISFADSDTFSFTNGTDDLSFTITAWVYFTGFSIVGNWLIEKRSGSSGGDEWQFVYASNRLQLAVFDKTNNAINLVVSTSVSSPFSLNTWYFITATYNGSKSASGMRLYINSVNQSLNNSGSGAYTGMTNSASLVTFGLTNWGLANVRHQGYLEDVNIWKKRVLNQGEINNLYNSGSGRTYPY